MGGWSQGQISHRSRRRSKKDARSVAENQKRLARLAEIEVEKMKVGKKEE